MKTAESFQLPGISVQSRFWAAILLFAAASFLTAQQPGQRTFATPQEAAQALADAAAQNDTAALLHLFGPQGNDIVRSGDPALDAGARANFTRRAKEKMEAQIEPSNPGHATVVVGNDNWPFPVPLIRAKSGEWYFDTAHGRTEILARRIGRNELAAIDVCRGYVEAQMAYASHDYTKDGVLQYAQKLISTPGKQDGLYWEGQAGTLIPKDFADATEVISTAAQSGKKTPYHGYYFRMLKGQGPEATGGAHAYIVKGEMIGGFGLVAYPAQYGVSGIRTFIVNQDGVVYEKDLGAMTKTLARQMVRFNPDKTWEAIKGE